jgi:hypothetical protein
VEDLFHVNLEDWCRLNVGWTGEVAILLCAGVLGFRGQCFLWMTLMDDSDGLGLLPTHACHLRNHPTSNNEVAQRCPLSTVSDGFASVRCGRTKPNQTLF